MRRALGIAPFKPTPKSRRWTPAEAKLLGTLPDAELARRFKRTEHSVALHRRRLRIAKPDPKIRAPRPWTLSEVKLLGRHFDSEVARRLGRTRDVVSRERLKRRIQPLRRMPDRRAW